ncbi:hypothetical protein FJZ19_02810 [Candidatus Pacearchaeota archaeon]|nr:hypothetical protein [Candidatus Pacearchaeota archaeon]
MGWGNTKNKHQQVIVTANAWDMQRIEERNRRRKWFIFLDVVLIVCILIGIGFIYYNKNYQMGGIFLVIGIFILLYLVFRKRRKPRNVRRFRQHRNFKRNRRHRRR